VCGGCLILSLVIRSARVFGFERWFCSVNRERGASTHLNVFDAPIGSQPLSNQGTMFVRPVLVELFFRQLRVAFCADSNAYELIRRHRGVSKRYEMEHVARRDVTTWMMLSSVRITVD
jgi:hypothetical protein